MVAVSARDSASGAGGRSRAEERGVVQLAQLSPARGAPRRAPRGRAGRERRAEGRGPTMPTWRAAPERRSAPGPFAPTALRDGAEGRAGTFRGRAAGGGAERPRRGARGQSCARRGPTPALGATWRRPRDGLGGGGGGGRRKGPVRPRGRPNFRAAPGRSRPGPPARDRRRRCGCGPGRAGPPHKGRSRRRHAGTHRRRPHLADAGLLGDGPDLVDEGEGVGELLPAGLEDGALGRGQELGHGPARAAPPPPPTPNNPPTAAGAAERLERDVRVRREVGGGREGAGGHGARTREKKSPPRAGRGEGAAAAPPRHAPL